MRPLRIGVAGLGVISRYYVEALADAPEVALVAACDRDRGKLAPFRDAGAATYTDFRALARDPDVDAVVVNLPNDLHYDACLAALDGGKHVCCEKPMTLTSAEADALSRAASGAGRTLFTAFHRAYNVNFDRLMRAAPRPDRIRRVEAYYLERIQDHAGSDLWYMDPDRGGGGCIADNGPNVFDLLSRLMGRLEVAGAEVTGRIGRVDVEARVRLVNEFGAAAEVHLDWAFQRGEAKGLVVELTDGRRITADLLAGFPEFKGSLRHEYAAILRDFARRVALGAHPHPAGADAVRLVEDAYRLARSPSPPEVIRA